MNVKAQAKNTAAGCFSLLVSTLAFLLASSLAARPGLAQDDTRKPDAPYVPTPQIVVDEMLRIADVGPRDFVIDLGSGDGRIVITAAKKFGARAMGVELDFHLLIQSEESARRAGVAERVKFVQEDLFRTDLSAASVITLYLFPEMNLKLRPKLLALRPGTRIVAHDFDLGDWRPDAKSRIRKDVMLWIVPAQVAGRWRSRIGLPPIERHLELEFTQRYQEVSAHARLNGVPAPVWEARLSGDRLSFAVVDSTDPQNEATLYFEGRVAGEVIEGEVARGVGTERLKGPWRAVRSGR
ncbi:MAG TPA: class I SAM-dependent methyltransferase [Burkholderiales bacterium]|nr:class I SAM-dependent methyltransferase [Burkholderiales bacterium]